MGRTRRALVDGLSVHVTQRGNNKMNIFVDDYDRQVFLRFLRRIVQDVAIQLHAFALMTTHTHLVITASPSELPRAMQSLALKHTRYFNKKYARCGTIWGERYKSRVIGDERYALNCLRYVEQNPVRAHIVSAPADYRWCSYHAYASGEFPEWLTPHPVYVGLGSTPDARQNAYRALFAEQLTDEQLVEQRHE
ncbi:MAG TPA: transposase [Vicinamibacterales bacterium]|nr:transposase [Vicinamibacterales bacterium]